VDRRTRIAVAMACIAFVAACAPAPAPGSPAAGLADTTWTVQTINGVAVLPAARPTLTFAQDGTVAGSASCNQYSGPYRIDGDRIVIGDLASTLMLCEGEVGAQEIAFLGALRGGQTWRINGAGDLEIGGIGSIVAGPGVAEGPPPSEPGHGLDGTSWNLAGMGDTADFARIVPTIEFGADGSASGFSGCNTFSGTFTTDGETIALGPLATTKMGCERPASAVETEYLRALSGVTTWSIEPDGRLLLAGSVPLRYTPR
jgi:heat shock protein HslJ